MPGLIRWGYNKSVCNSYQYFYTLSTNILAILNQSISRVAMLWNFFYIHDPLNSVSSIISRACRWRLSRRYDVTTPSRPILWATSLTLIWPYKLSRFFSLTPISLRKTHLIYWKLWKQFADNAIASNTLSNVFKIFSHLH